MLPVGGSLDYTRFHSALTKHTPRTRITLQLYFLSGLFLLCGIVSIPAIVHNMRNNPPDTELLARGSAAGAERTDFSADLTMFVDFTVVVRTWGFSFSQPHANVDPPHHHGC